MTAYDDLSDEARNLMAGFSELDIAEIAVDASRAAAKATAERDDAYRERTQLLAWLAALHPAVLAPAPDVEEEGWHILYLTFAGHQGTWHISPRDLDLLGHITVVSADDPRAQWNGHTTDQKYWRIRRHVEALAATPAP